LDFKTTEELSFLEGTIGHKRAVDALEFGLDIEITGFNIYAFGLPDTGEN